MDSEDNHSPEKAPSEDIMENEVKDDISEIPDKKIQKEKSEPIKLIIILMIVVGIAGYFSGSYFSNPDSELVTKTELAEAISELESKMVNTQQLPSQPSQPLKISIDDDPMRGDPNAPITIVEFSDFQCPFCARFHVQTLPSLLEEYIDAGKVNLVYRDFPIPSIHPNALPAAVAAECANEQGKYWDYHDTLFEKQSDWSRLDSNAVIVKFSQYATEIGLEQEQFDSCLDTGKYLEEVQGDLSDGRAYDVTGTPGFFIGNDQIGFVKINGAQPFDSFQRVIDAQLET
ncbi:MAG TPA: DsbA family protein [Nitrosopumilaceae archaeon]|jgi:protein-disulfide isomerase|nr:DsbA family protein [Nitrosopumilaceae archaeon]